jgi:hypothetical protein
MEVGFRSVLVTHNGEVVDSKHSNRPSRRTFALFTWEFAQYEAIHHGQWSIYASLAGFETPLSWRASSGS